MSRSPALRDKIAGGILEAAAGVLADRPTASMAEIAEAVGVGRATLYRYFPNRDALLRALVTVAIADLGELIADAELETVPVREALARITRGLVAGAGRYRALARVDKDAADAVELQRLLDESLRALFRRGGSDGTFRADVPTDVLLEIYIGLLEGVVARVTSNRLGVEQASAAIVTVFLTGALDEPSRADPG